MKQLGWELATCIDATAVHQCNDFKVNSGKQVALDEFMFTPVHIAAFFSFLTAAEGGNWEVRAHRYNRHMPLPWAANPTKACTVIHFGLLCVQDIKEKLRKDYVSTLLTELVIWPGYQVSAESAGGTPVVKMA